MLWEDETLYPYYKQSFSNDCTICNIQSEFQKIHIFKSKSHGKVLMLDGIVQLTEKDEFIYHEMLVHTALCTHKSPKRVLVIGGGDGGVIRRVLEHKTIEHVTLVEIDPQVISLSREFLPKVSAGAFADKRLKVLTEDGDKFVATTEDTFDVIITDRGDDIGPGQVLFAKRFYSNCYRILTKNGVLVAMTGVPALQASTLKKSFLILREIFAYNTCFTIPVPTYIGGLMAITWSSKSNHGLIVSKTKIQDRMKEVETNYYNTDVHQAAFMLPEFIKEIIDSKHPIT
jgi:spermidine synthase